MRKIQKTIPEQTSDDTLVGIELSRKKHPGGRPIASDDDRVRMGQLIKKYRTAAKMDQADLARELGCCTGNAVGGWELGRNCPAIPVIPKLCRILNIPIHEIMGMEAPIPTLPKEDERHLNNYHALSQYNQQSIDQLILRMLNEQERNEHRILRHYHSRVIFPDQLSTAAGTGAPAPDYVEPEIVYMRASRASERCDLMLKVNGDSMEPNYPDGCRVFVATDEETPVEEVGVFIFNGEYYIKERHEDCLYSINRLRDDIPFFEGNDIRHYGRVIGIVNEDDVLEGEELDRVREAYEDEEE